MYINKNIYDKDWIGRTLDLKIGCLAFTLRESQLMNGTSMTAPHVAGAVGGVLMLEGIIFSEKEN